MKSKKKKPKSTKAGRQILAALEEIVDAVESGVPLAQRFTVHEVEIIEPGEYSASAIRAIREKLRVSQPVFAKIVGVSTILVQSWEQGKRFPDGPARRVLDEMGRNPAHWAAMIRFRTVRAA